MKVEFYKYQGAGNDFIMIDGRSLLYVFSQHEIEQLCHRRFGVGADGFIILKNHDKYTFTMDYYNSDGKPSSMCGNGGRCIVAFAKDLGIQKDVYTFEAADGYHEATIKEKIENGYIVNLKMNNVKNIRIDSNNLILNTGSPHYVKFVENIDALDIIKEAHLIRYNEEFRKDGINVNFVYSEGQSIHVRTYERGVENETWSCGTGVTASAIATKVIKGFIPNKIITKGGILSVTFNEINNQFENVHLTGPAQNVYKGFFEI